MTTSFTSRQLATNYEILVARTEFLVALATRKAQFRTLKEQCGGSSGDRGSVVEAVVVETVMVVVVRPYWDIWRQLISL